MICYSRVTHESKAAGVVAKKQVYRRISMKGNAENEPGEWFTRLQKRKDPGSLSILRNILDTVGGCFKKIVETWN